MNITIACKVSLSQKLRKLLGGADSDINLVAHDLKNGKGDAVLILSSDSQNEISEEEIKKIGETSVILIPEGIADDMPSDAQGLSSLFNEGLEEQQMNQVQRDAIDRIAAVVAPEQSEVSNAIVKQSEKIIPNDFKEMAMEPCNQWITNMKELIEQVNKANTKEKQEIDLSTANNPRERAVLMEMIEKAGGIDKPAWIVNDKAGMITVNDINIDLPLNEPFNLMNVPAKKLSMSSELKSLVNNGLVKFVSPNEAAGYYENGGSGAETIGELEVFDDPEQAQANMSKRMELASHDVDDEDVMEVTEDNAEEVFEEEGMILDLAGSLPKTKSEKDASMGSDTRRTTHRNRPSTKEPSSTNHPTIRRKG